MFLKRTVDKRWRLHVSFSRPSEKDSMNKQRLYMVRKRGSLIQPRDYSSWSNKVHNSMPIWVSAWLAAQFNESKLIYDRLKEYFFSSDNKSMRIFYHPASQSQILHRLPFLLRNQKDKQPQHMFRSMLMEHSWITNLHYELLFLGTCSIATFNISYFDSYHLWTLIYWNSSLFSGPSLIEAAWDVMNTKAGIRIKPFH